LTQKVRSLVGPAVVIVLLGVALFGLGGLVTWRMAGSIGAAIDHARLARHEVETTEQLMLSLTKAESAQRGFLLTQRQEYLRPFDSCVAEVDQALASLTDDAQTDSWMIDDLARLRGAAVRKITELKHSLDVDRTDGAAAAVAIVQTDVGLTGMQDARAAADALAARAYANRDAYTRILDDRQGHAVLAAMLAAALVAALLCFAALRQLAARARLIRAEALLRQEGELLQSTVDHIRDGVAVFDDADRLLLWNAAFFPISGLTLTLAAQGTPFSDVVAAASDWPETMLAGRPPAGEPTIGEVKRGGQMLEVWRSTLPAGRQMIAIADITRRTQAEAIASQAQKMEALGHLTGGVAHDFNNLLQVVSASLELIDKRLPPELGLAPNMAAARAGVERGARLTRHLLAFARRQPLAPVAIDTTELMNGMEDLLRRTLGAAVTTDIIVPEALWPIRADPQQLENAVLNLAINARDAMPEGGRLTIEAENAALDDVYVAANADVAPGQYVMIAVTDTGVGMTPEQVARAVEPFYTTKPDGSGTGLGLSMVYGFARQSGGHFTLYSEPGHGTTARLYIPRSDVAPVRSAPERRDTPMASGELVLVVEDDPSVRATVWQALQELGYRVLVADSAAAALALLRSGARPDLLFTDVVMPGRPTARDLAQEAVQMLDGHLVVVFTSGYTENAIVHQGRLDPGIHLLAKPYVRSDLALKLRAVLAAPP